MKIDIGASSVSNKWWSFLFGGMMLAALGLFIVAPFVGWWLPKGVSTYGDGVDALFYLILAITGFFFVLTEFLLVYFMYLYASGPGTREHPVGHHYAEKKVFWTSFFKSAFRPVSALLHDQHRVELAWTLVPAVILLYIAFAQINTWAEIKDPASMPAKPDLAMEVSARLFEWRVRYRAKTPAGEVGPQELAQWAENREVDDLHVVNEVHVWRGAKVKVFLKSRDVIHSFYLPNLRLKQDALPGKTIPVWFEVNDLKDRERAEYLYNTAYNRETGRWEDGYDPRTESFLDPAEDHSQTWELACAELCGWGHYKMRGKLFVHKDKADYEKWFESAKNNQFRLQPEAADTRNAR
jgi:cytochrome c oxidase subunit II